MASKKPHLLEKLKSLPREQIIEAVKSLSPQQAEEILFDWDIWAREKQREPEGDWLTWFLNCGRGFGKLLDKNTPILTTKGWKTVGEVAVGDFLYDENGLPTQVIKTFDATPEKSYRLHFSDGSFIDCCNEHQWITWERKDRKAWGRSQYESGPLPQDWPNWTPKKKVGTKKISEDKIKECLDLHKKGYSERKISSITGVSRDAMRPHITAVRYVEKAIAEQKQEPDFRVKTTQDIIDTFTYGKRGDINHSIPVSKPLELPEQNLLIDPYIFGYWLGDGSVYNSGFTCGEEDQNHLKNEINKAGYSFTKPKNKLSVTALGLITDLKKIGAEGKAVPQQYWMGSVEQRLALLQGLMDSDGCANKANVEFTAKRKQHADLVLWLARSLGQKPVMLEGRATLNGADCGVKYTVTWTPIWGINPFRLPRKSERVRQDVSSKSYHRYITAYEEIEAVPMRCFTVDSPNSLFLVGESLIPTHNTRTGAETVRKWVKQGMKRIAAIAPTQSDIKKVMVFGESGLLSVCSKYDKLKNGVHVGMPRFSPTDMTMYWYKDQDYNTKPIAKVEFFSAEEPERLRGPQFEAAWADELGSWTRDEATWDMLQFCLRLETKANKKRPRVVITTTPKSTKLIRKLVTKPSTLVVQGTTYDNKENLAASYIKAIEEEYEGTRLGRQEIYAEILTENAGALWTAAMIDSCQIEQEEVPDLVRIVVAVDPATTNNVESDSTGIIVAGVDINGIGYVLGDYTMKDLPEKWATKAVDLYHEFEASRLVYEKNQGGDMIPTLFRQVDENVPLRGVHASIAKIARAEPVSALYERGKVKHVRNPKNGASLTELETQMTTYEPMGKHKSPDRYDALVWALTDLMLKGRARPELSFSYASAAELQRK